ncbi:rod shape-determining protein RodA [Paenibacillus sp. MER TA 81-3]|uniref:FtsW/RodA/SpoVE family cell cycle protein n=1 Tax=Paenibacillus sp. MER TA 81-3 TaxID=2939573 RepID=UPI00203F8AD3|nr:FtsW/RodA/SpoVE family cell cycle protein [Paenibacillus sp. MER TA 81-3]MCM3337583.1 rod shape-determining protein RodA [Paenibacillus sp. MER TA 81-3]
MLRKLKRVDPLMVWILLCFMAVSTIVIYSATTNTSYEGLHKNNMMLYAAFFIPLLVTAWFDYRVVVRYLSVVLYVTGIALLALVMFKGVDINGSVRWIAIGGQQFQPSELMKLFTILMLARFLGLREGEELRLVRDIVPLGLIIAIPVFFVLKQPDLGTSIVFAAIFVAMIWMANVRMSHMIIGLSATAAVIVSIVVLYYTNSDLLAQFIKPHQMARIETFLNPTSDSDQAWHVMNSIRAIGSGRLSGDGFTQGFFIHSGYIPYSYSDSIFVVIGEEFGFLGSAMLILLYFLLIYRMVLIVKDSNNLEGAYLVVGIIAMFTLQIFENIAMHIGLMPLTGLSLPFISYGGSSLLTNMISIGLVLSVKIHQEEPDLLEPLTTKSVMFH